MLCDRVDRGSKLGLSQGVGEGGVKRKTEFAAPEKESGETQ